MKEYSKFTHVYKFLGWASQRCSSQKETSLTFGGPHNQFQTKEYDEIFENIQLVKMKSSKFINYSINMNWNGQGIRSTLYRLQE